MAAEGFIGRWSRLKRDAQAQGEQPTTEEADAIVFGAAAGQESAEFANGEPAAGLSKPAAGFAAVASSEASGMQADPALGRADGERFLPPQGRAVGPLPSIDSLGKDSDFSLFMRAGVDPGLRVSALKKLFADPHFNRMDGLDIYIDDYSKPDPMPLAFIRRLDQSRILGLAQDPAPEQEASLDQAPAAGDQEAIAEAAPGEPSSSAVDSTAAIPSNPPAQGERHADAAACVEACAHPAELPSMAEDACHPGRVT